MSELSDFHREAVIKALEDSVRRNMGDGLLLSGGLDTAILAYISSKWVKLDCITVALQGAPAPDVDYARLVASHLELKHHIHYFDTEELYDNIRTVIRIMKSFDPMEIRNDAAVYIALKVGRDNGMSSIMTGNGCDELFAGYSFFFNLKEEEIDTALENMWTDMRFA